MRCNNQGLFLLVIALAFGLSMSVTVLAQSTATLQGTVTDTKGAVVPNATVTARNKGTSFERTSQTEVQPSLQVHLTHSSITLTFSPGT